MKTSIITISIFSSLLISFGSLAQSNKPVKIKSKDGVGFGAKEAALDLVSQLPYFSPAIRSNKIVRSYYTLPVYFKSK